MFANPHDDFVWARTKPNSLTLVGLTVTVTASPLVLYSPN